MREREQLRGQSIDTTAAFLAIWAPRHPRLGRWHAKFADAVKRLRAIESEEWQVLHQMAGTARLKHTAARLRERFLLRIAASGRKLLRNVAGAEKALRVPPKRGNPAEIVDAARRLNAFLKPKARRLFIDAGFEPDFWTSFGEARAALDVAVSEAAAERGKPARLTGRMRALIREGRADIEVLSGVLEPLLADDEAMRNEWERARQVPHKLGRPTEAKLRRRAGRATAETTAGTPS